MQKYKQQIIEEKVRARHERIGSLMLAVMTLAGLVTITRANRSIIKEVVPTPALVLSQISERENETARIPVRFDIGIHSPTTGGL